MMLRRISSKNTSDICVFGLCLKSIHRELLQVSEIELLDRKSDESYAQYSPEHTQQSKRLYTAVCAGQVFAEVYSI